MLCNSLCLGFDIEATNLNLVRYTIKRDDITLDTLKYDNFFEKLLARKYQDWVYEQEYRWIVPLENLPHEGNLYFKPFGSDLFLSKIIVGPRCELTPYSINMMGGVNQKAFKIIKARIAFRSFRIVQNLQGFKQPDSRRS